MKQHYIYMTTNNINGMKYIGQHYGELDDSYLGSGTILKQALKKYGKENFSKEILYISSSEQENDQKEIEIIQLYNATQNPQFYNLHSGGTGGNTTAGFTEEQKKSLRAKLSLVNSGEGNGMYGKHHSIETRQYLSFWSKYTRDNSVYRTKEFLSKMSMVTSGSANGMYGRVHSDESKRKMSESSKGKTLGAKNGMYGKTGNNAINGKWVEMYDKNYNFIQKFNSKKSVLEFLGVKGHTQLNKAIANQTLYKDYYWKEIDKINV